MALPLARASAEDKLPTIACPSHDQITAQIGNQGEAADEFAWLYGVLSHRGTNYGHSAYNEVTRGQQAYSPQANMLASDRDPLDIALRRTRALLEDLKTTVPLTAQEQLLAALETQSTACAVSDLKARFAIFEQVGRLRRQITFANPLVQGMDRMVLIKREAFPDAEQLGNHMCDQFFGFHATNNGTTRGDGLFVLDKPFSDHPVIHNVIENATVENGRFQGKKLDFGGFLSPSLSYDGRTILFAWTEGDGSHRYVWNEHTTFHIFKVNADGTHLTQVTDGVWNDFDPCYLPNGRVIFISERRGGFGRCHGRPVPSYTLHTMFDDGTDIVCLSPHETNEWMPSVDHNGMVVYTRWDYVDRGFNQAHQAWITYPDGRDPRSLSANNRKSQNSAPIQEMDVKAIPGSSCYVATASAHHGEARGSLVFIDPRITDDDGMAQIKRITPDQLFPEAEFSHSHNSGAYATAWPLSEKYYLCAFERNANATWGDIDMAKRRYGVYLIDAFGNRELLYRDPQISCLSPIPLQARQRPPVVPHGTLVGQPRGADQIATGPVPEELPHLATVGVTNVYNSRYPLPEGVKIKYLRVWQLFPKIASPHADNPKLGYGSQKGSKADLGIVPVEDDGSACWLQPVGVPVLYHLLDENGMAVQGMRTAAYVHPGETLLCMGCHEQQTTSPRIGAPAKAMRRAPSTIQPEFDGTNPFSYPRLVQPVLDRNCVSCHGENSKSIDLRPGNYLNNSNYHYTSFNNLRPYVRFYDNAVFTEPSTIPGEFGARIAPLYRLLDRGHKDVKLSKDDMLRLTIWLDSNGLFYGHDHDIKAQAQGQVVWPALQ